MMDGSKYFSIGLDTRQLMRDVEVAKRSFASLSDGAVQEGAKIDNAFGKIRAAAISLGAGWSAKELVSQLVRVRGEFQQLEVAFTTMLGSSERANALMSQLTETAAKTPFDLQGVANGARQLLAYGTAADDVNDTLIRLGNIAAGLSIPLNDLVYLYGTTMTQGRLYTQDLNQFTGRGIPMIKELAKQFGVAENEIKGMVEAGKVGFPEVQKVIQSLTNEGGMFFNLMQEQSKTITGQISNIQDSFEMMLNNIGQSSEGIINTALSGVSWLVENYEQVGRTLLELVAAYGAYRAALIAITAIQKAHQAVMAQALVNMKLAHAASISMTRAQAIATARTKLLTAATQKLNRTLLKNPYALVAAAVVALGYGIYKLVTYQTEAEKAQERLNDASKEYEKSLASERVQINELFGRLKAATKGTDEWREAKEAIMSRYGEYLQGLGDEKTALDDVATAYDAVCKAAEQAAKSRAMNEFMTQEADKLAEARTEALKNIKEILTDAFEDNGQLASTFFFRIKPLVEDVDISSFDLRDKGINKALLDAGADLSVLNDIGMEFNRLAKASGLYKQNMAEARELWGDAPRKGGDAKVTFTLDGKSISQIEEQIEKEKEALTELAKSGNAGYGEIDAMKEYVSSLEEAVIAREKELKTINEIEARISTLKKRQKETAYGSAEYNALQSRIDSLDSRMPSTKAERKSAETQAKTRAKAEQDAADMLLELQRKNQQSEVDLIKDGTQRKLAQIRADYDAQREAIEENARKLAELNKKAGTTGLNQNGLTKEQQGAVDKAGINSVRQYLMDIAAIYAEQRKSEDDAMRDYLKQYGDYQERKLAITQEYAHKISEANTEGARLALMRQRDDELADLAISSGSGSAISGIFGNMADKSLTELRQLYTEGSKALEFLKGGQWDAGQGISLGIDSGTFDVLSKSPEALSKIAEALKTIKNETDSARTPLQSLGEGFKALFEEGAADDPKKFEQALQDIQSGLGGIATASSFVGNSFSQMGEALGNDALSKIGEALNVVSDVANSAMQGAQAGAMFGPIGAAAGAALGVVTSLITAMSKIHDSKHQERIEKLQDEIDELGDTYDKLERKADKAYSIQKADVIREQNDNLREQQELIRQQMAEEEAKKDTDEDKMEEYRDQLNDLTEQIEDNMDAIGEAITGVSFDSFRSNFLDTLADMDSSAQDFADSFEEYMRRSILDAMMTELYDDRIKQLYKNWVEAFDDGVVTRGENEALRREQAAITNDMLAARNELAKTFGWDTTTGSDQNATVGVAESMSQESADELNGRFAAIQTIMGEVRDNIKIGGGDIAAIRSEAAEAREMIQGCYTQLVAINDNTRAVVKPILNIEAGIDTLNTLLRNSIG